MTVRLGVVAVCSVLTGCGAIIGLDDVQRVAADAGLRGDVAAMGGGGDSGPRTDGRAKDDAGPRSEGGLHVEAAGLPEAGHLDDVVTEGATTEGGADASCVDDACASPACAPSCTSGSACGAPGDCAAGVCANGECVGDPFFSSVVLLMHFDGADGSTAFTDQLGHTVTGLGTAALTTSTGVTGGASLALNGGALSIPNSADWDLSTGDSTVELWINASPPSSPSNAILSQSPVSNDEQWVILFTGGGVDIQDNGGQNNFSAGAIASSTWTHLAVVRSAGMTLIFINGALVGSTAVNFYTSSPQPLFIGGADTTSFGFEFCWSGFIDELRITKGVARYTSTFTPSMDELPNGP